MLRNLGIKQAPSDFVLVIDTDFVPSVGLAGFSHEIIVPRIVASREKVVVVVPALAMSSVLHYSAYLPWSELRRMYQQGHYVLPDAGSGHGPTQLGVLLEPTIYAQTENFYEVCYDSQWEPYYVMAKRYFKFDEHVDLGYDERFTNQGGDKQSHALKLNALGFRFLVAREQHLLHLYHPSRTAYKPSDSAMSGRWNWDGGFKSSKSKFSYFDDFLPKVMSEYGFNVRWPRGCKRSWTPLFNRFANGVLIDM